MNKGFTLLEAIIAILILTVGLVAILQVFPIGFGMEISNRRETLGTMLGQEKIEEINSKSYRDIEVITQIEDPLPSPFEKFSRETKVNYVDANLQTTTTDTGLKKIEVKVSWDSPLWLEKESVKIITLITER